MGLLERLEGEGVSRIHYGFMSFPVTLGTGLRAGILRRGAQDPKKGIAGSIGNDGISEQVGASADEQPRWII